jgi:hypothetical protein
MSSAAQGTLKPALPQPEAWPPTRELGDSGQPGQRGPLGTGGPPLSPPSVSGDRIVLWKWLSRPRPRRGPNPLVHSAAAALFGTGPTACLATVASRLRFSQLTIRTGLDGLPAPSEPWLR